MPAQLYVRITSGPAAGQSFSPTAGSTLVVGRDASCGVVIADSAMSKRHLELHWDGVRVAVRDLDSTNGTRLNGASVRSATVSSGDTIDAGRSTLSIEIVDTPEMPAPAGTASAAHAAAAAATDGGTADPAHPAALMDEDCVRLRIVAGPHKGTTVRVPRGEQVVLGRDLTCTVTISDDVLSGRHFDVSWDGRACRLRDLRSANGTQVNRASVREALLRDGDTIEAGLSRFLVVLPAPTPLHPAATVETPPNDAADPAAEPPQPVAAEVPPNALLLRVIRGRRGGAVFAVAAQQTAVGGREADCAISVDDLRMSRRHFEISWDGRVARCRDLGSSGGTTVNGVRIRDTVLTVLEDRDEIGVGDTLFLVRKPEPIADVAAAEPAAGVPAGGEPEALENELRCVVLKVLRGRHAGEMLVAAPAARVVVGRDADCQIRLDEHEVSGHHFELTWDDPDWRLRDLGSANGTVVNGKRLVDTVVRDRDEIALGRALVLVRLPQIPPPPLPEPIFPLPIFDAFVGATPPPILPGTDDDHLLAALGAALDPQPSMRLYALIDGAQAVELAVIARQLGHPVFTLFSGAAAPSLAHVGPCLVELQNAQPFLARWRAALGRNAGILLKSGAAVDPLSRHLREIFVVTDETSQEYFFRYYDPRVLRTFLPTCTRDELRAFFGPVTRWFVEDAGTPAYLALSIDAGALRSERIAAPVAAGSDATAHPGR